MGEAEWAAQIEFQRSLYGINQEFSEALSALYEANEGLSSLERILKDRKDSPEDSAARQPFAGGHQNLEEGD